MLRTLTLTLAVLALAAQPFNHHEIVGFTADGTETQKALEAEYDALLDAENLRTWMEHLTQKPRHVGSPYGKETAEFMVEQFRSWGYEAELETFEVLFPEPIERVVELVEPTQYTAKLDEPALEEDATSSVRENMLPPYNSYSANGDVTAELVYVNYGIPEDYEALERRGISVEGKIVIARYGRSWRGIKPKVAAEHGAVGCLIYSDPYDDGYYQGETYPDGPYRPDMGAQRGSVSDMPLYPGDPLTPGVGAKADTERLSVEESPTIMKIPVLPISYGDAQPLLAALGGPVAPPDWRGALPITYYIGPGPAKVHLKLEFDFKLETAYNVVARLEGAEYPDEWVMRGNHHDAWVFGAADPISGMIALMEEARAIGELARQGQRPKRTLVYAGWDAEEPGLLGSTEWAEYHADELREKAAVYINTDGNGRGFLHVGGSHALEKLVNQVAADVTDPQTEVSVAARARAARMVGGDQEAVTRTDLRISPLGSGSDYTPFLQHLGIATLNLGFGGENGGGAYHSAYDSFDHYTRFGDPNFDYGIALAKVAGRLTLRFANADVLPFRFSGLADNVQMYLNEVTELADRLRQETEQTNTLIEHNAYTLAADPTQPFVAPEPKEPVPYFSFAPLQNAVSRLETAAKTYDAALSAALASEQGVSAEVVEQVNDLLTSAERTMTREEGLPRRSWFQHQIYAPGFYTGYGVKTLPGVREALEQREWEEAETQIPTAAAAINRITDRLDQLTVLLAGNEAGE